MVAHEYFNIDLAKGFLLMGYFELAERLINVHFQSAGVEGSELLLAFAVDLNYQVLILEGKRQDYLLVYKLSHQLIIVARLSHLNKSHHARFDITELFSIVFKERRSREQNLCIDHVVLDHDLTNVDRLD